MAVTIIRKGAPDAPVNPAPATTRKNPLPNGRPPGIKNKRTEIYMIPLDQPGRVRKAQFKHLLGGMADSAFSKGIKNGKYLPPDGFDPRAYWHAETIRNFL